MKIPLHAWDLIDRLDELFPEVLYDTNTDFEAFLLKQGERRLVNWLKDVRRIEQAERMGVHDVQ